MGRAFEEEWLDDLDLGVPGKLMLILVFVMNRCSLISIMLIISLCRA